MLFHGRSHSRSALCSLLCLFTLSSLSLLAPPARAESVQPPTTQQKSILVLNSYHSGFPWTDDLVRSISSHLEGEFKHLETLVEYMDAKRFSEASQSIVFRELLRVKYASRHLDLVVATDDTALRFLRDYGAELFAGIPVVFCGASDEELIKGLDRSVFTGVREEFSTAELMKMARRIRPDARRAYIVVDASDANRSFADTFRKQLGTGSEFDLVFLSARFLGLQGILDRLRNADNDSVVIALSFTQDWHGTVVRLEDAMEAIAGASPVPVISPNISTLGQGILAGNTNGGINHGVFTAEVAAQVLKGDSPASIPIRSEGGFGPIFDYAAMSRWKVSEDQLPPQAVVLNKPTGLWVTYRKWVLLACGLIGLQMAIIGLLAWSIAARRKAQSALRQSEVRYRDMVENAFDGIYSHDLDGRMTEVNGTMLNILGYERHELLSMSSISLVEPEFHHKILESTARKIAGEETPPYEVVVVSKDGRKRWIEIRSRIQHRNGKPWRIEGVVRDISQRKQLELQLQQAMKLEALGRLAGGVAHDFNNMLTVICGYANLLLKESPTPKQRERLDQIRRAGDQATQLTRHLLSFSRSQPTEPTLVDMNQVVQNMVKMLRRFIGEDVTILTQLQPDLGSVMADPTQIGQVVMNLALNARDAMPGGGTLTIETFDQEASPEQPPQVVLKVSDTGVGMGEETLSRVFDPFFTTKDPGRGTGLGLSVAYRIVRQYEGEIAIESEPGKGTSFRVSFPGLRAAPSDVLEQGDSADSRGTETILVVEDRLEVREFTVNVLSGAGYRVVSAGHGAEALDVFHNANKAIDLLLTDVIMPGITGPQLAARLIDQRPSLRVLLMSGFTAGAEFDEKHGAPLAKPFSPADLLRRVRSELDAVGSRSQGVTCDNSRP